MTMQSRPEMLKILSSIFNTSIQLTTIDYKESGSGEFIPARTLVIDFNDIDKYHDNDNIHRTVNGKKKYVSGSTIYMKDGKKYWVNDVPADINTRITEMKAANMAKLEKLGIKLIV